MCSDRVRGRGGSGLAGIQKIGGMGTKRRWRWETRREE